MSYRELWGLFGGFAMGFLAGGAWLARRLANREQRRRDEASQFAPLDTVNFGDGSYIVVASVAPRQRAATEDR